MEHGLGFLNVEGSFVGGLGFSYVVIRAPKLEWN